MEQRTRILHHTRSKTPIILASKPVKNRIPASNSLSSLSKKRHEKAPLASLDKDLGASPRHNARPRDYECIRSSSAGRREVGSKRIVSKEFLKSDQISDYLSTEDEEAESPSRSVSVRRHTLGSATCPWGNPNDSPQPEQSSRKSSVTSSNVPYTSDQPKWNTPRRSLPNGPMVSYEPSHVATSQSPDHNSSRNSDPIKSSSNHVSSYTLTNTSSQMVSSPSSLTYSDLYKHQVPYTSNSLPRPALSIQHQKNAIPTSLSSQLVHRNVINQTSPGASKYHTLAVSSHRQSISHPPSSLSVNTSNNSLSPPVISASSGFRSQDHTPQTPTSFPVPSNALDNNWRTDPRRRPVRASAEFDLIQNNGHHDITSPKYVFVKSSATTDVNQSVHSRNSHSSSKPHSSPSKVSNTRQSIDTKREVHEAHHINAGLSRQIPQQQCKESLYNQLPRRHEDNRSPREASSPSNTDEQGSTFSSFDQKISTRNVTPIPKNHQGPTSPSHKCLNNDNHHGRDYVSPSCAQSDIHLQGTENESSLSPQQSNLTQHQNDSNTQTKNIVFDSVRHEFKSSPKISYSMDIHNSHQTYNQRGSMNVIHTSPTQNIADSINVNHSRPTHNQRDSLNHTHPSHSQADSMNTKHSHPTHSQADLMSTKHSHPTHNRADSMNTKHPHPTHNQADSMNTRHSQPTHNQADSMNTRHSHPTHNQADLMNTRHSHPTHNQADSMNTNHSRPIHNHSPYDNYFNQISETSFCSQNPTKSIGGQRIDLFDDGVGFSYCRKRDSMRMATEGYLNMSDVSQSVECIKLGDSKNTLEYSYRSSRSVVAGSHKEVISNTVDYNHTSGSSKISQKQAWSVESAEKPNALDSQCNMKTVESSRVHTRPFVRRSMQRDSYRLATSSNPDLTIFGQDDDIFFSCEDIVHPNRQAFSRNVKKSGSNDDSTGKLSQPNTDSYSTVTSNQQSKTYSPPTVSTNLLNSDNAETLSKIKRHSLRLATASLSDLSVILDEIDIGEPAGTPVPNDDFIELPSPLLTHRSPTLSPYVERSLGRSGSSVSSRNSSSFGSFYSCQSMGPLSAKNSPNHVPSHASVRDSKPAIRTPDSVHKLIINSNAHDSGISQSSEDTNSYYTPANTSIGSAEDMDYGMKHLAQGGSLNRKKPVFYWTRQSPHPRPAHNTIPSSWKPKEVNPSTLIIHKSRRTPQSGSIRSYGSTSSVESSGSTKTKPTKNVPLTSQILRRYGCGLDGKSPILCNKGSIEKLSHNAMHGKHQSSHPNSTNPGNQKNFTLPLTSNNQFYQSNAGIPFDLYRQTPNPESPSDLESPTDTPRSPPSLGRPKRKLYAGFDSQPLPMDSFMSDSSSVYTGGVSCSSRGTDVSGQPDSGTFDESFYSIDNRSLYEENDCSVEASLTPQEFVNLNEIRKNTQLHEQRSNSLYSTSTTKGDAEDSYDEEDNMGKTMTPFSHHHSPHQVWSGQNYNQAVTPSLPMTFSI